jgi:uncharacterized protein
MRCFSGLVRQHPVACGWFLCALERATGPSQEIVIVGDPGAADTELLIAAIRSRYLPGSTVLFRSAPAPSPLLSSLAPFTRDMIRRDGKATAYVCSGHACSAPVTDPDLLSGQLE